MEDLKPVKALSKREQEAIRNILAGWKMIESAHERVMEAYLKIGIAVDVIKDCETHKKYGFDDWASFMKGLIAGSAPKLNPEVSLRNIFKIKRILRWMGEDWLRKLGTEKAELLTSVIRSRALYEQKLAGDGSVQVTLLPEATDLATRAVDMTVNEVGGLVEKAYGVEGSFTLALRIRSQEAFKTFLQTLVLNRIYCWSQGIETETISSVITTSVALAGTEVLREGGVDSTPLAEMTTERLEAILRTMSNQDPEFIALARQCVEPRIEGEITPEARREVLHEEVKEEPEA